MEQGFRAGRPFRSTPQPPSGPDVLGRPGTFVLVNTKSFEAADGSNVLPAGYPAL
jgi:hypothetical protein